MRRVVTLWKLFVGVLRELSDESGYGRHLRQERAMHSPEEWRRFQDRRLEAKYARAKCC
jgi:hypothetical protein